MLQPSDISSYADHISCDVMPGGSIGTPGLLRHIHELKEKSRAGHQTIMVHSAPASGKSRYLPDKVQSEIGGELLVLTPTTVDVVGMQPRMLGSKQDREHALRMAAASSDLNTMTMLLGNGVAVDAVGRSGFTALQFAVWAGANVDTIRLLMSYNACPYRRSANKKKQNAFNQLLGCNDAERQRELSTIFSSHTCTPICSDPRGSHAAACEAFVQQHGCFLPIEDSNRSEQVSKKNKMQI